MILQPDGYYMCRVQSSKICVCHCAICLCLDVNVLEYARLANARNIFRLLVRNVRPKVVIISGIYMCGRRSKIVMLDWVPRNVMIHPYVQKCVCYLGLA